MFICWATFLLTRVSSVCVATALLMDFDILPDVTVPEELSLSMSGCGVVGRVFGSSLFVTDAIFSRLVVGEELDFCAMFLS